MTKKINGAKIFSLITLSICFLLSISLADLFSNIITTNAFSSTDSKIKTNGFSLYAINVYSNKEETQIKNYAKDCMQKNCAGYVYKTNDTYNVLASCYENESDAQKVQQNLKKSNIESSIIKLDFKKVELIINVSVQEKTALVDAVNIFKTLYKKLYDLSISIDTNLNTNIESKIELGKIITDFTKVKTNFESIFNSKITTSLLEIKLNLIKINDILEELSNFDDPKIPFSSMVKNTYFKILFLQPLLVDKL